MITPLFRLIGPSPRRRLALLLAGITVAVPGGGTAFAATQRLPFTSGLYWAITAATTVGYGDVTAHNASGRIVASLVMLTTIPMLAAVFVLATGGAVTAGVRRLLVMHTHFPPVPTG